MTWRQLFHTCIRISTCLSFCFLQLLHADSIVYRDIKPGNIGFDVRGDVKVFDFGLSKGLSASLFDKRTKLYNLTPRTGSLPYMAPEIACEEPYDTKCDVFSLAILSWEILALQSAFRGYTKQEFLVRVALRRERPRIPIRWPRYTKSIIAEAWDHDPSKRPNMQRFGVMVQVDLNSLSSDDEAIQDRSKYMANRSNNSRRRLQP